MFCRKCGKEIPDDSVFCPKCGATVADEKETDSTEPEQDEETSVKEDIVPSENEDSVSIIREINQKIKNDAKESKQRTHKKTASKLLIIAAALAAVVAAALIVFIPQAGIGFEYELVDNDHYVITKYTGSDTEVTVPDTIWFKPVTIISASAFIETNITGVKIGKNIIGIGESAFMNCSSLKKVDCTGITPSDGSNFLIMKYAFKNCDKLENVILPDYCGITILEEAFLNCSNLKNVVMYDHGIGIPDPFIGATDKISYIESRAFSNCTSLPKIALHDVHLGRNAFAGCSGLKELWIHVYNVNNFLEEGAFSGCTSLKFASIYLETYTDIPAECFSGCTSLESFNYWGTGRISAIGDNAFKNCVNLSKLELEPYPSDVSETAFEGCTKLQNNSIPSDSQSKKSKLKDYLGIELAQLTYKEFTQNFGMPDEYYNGKAIYNVENSQYCVNFYMTGDYMGSSDGFHADNNDQILGLEIYGGKEIDVLYGMHLGEPLSYYDNMVDGDLASEVRLGAGDHGASWYEFGLRYETDASGFGLCFDIIFMLYPDSMEVFGVKFLPFYEMP